MKLKKKKKSEEKYFYFFSLGQLGSIIICLRSCFWKNTKVHSKTQHEDIVSPQGFTLSFIIIENLRIFYTDLQVFDNKQLVDLIVTNAKLQLHAS